MKKIFIACFLILELFTSALVSAECNCACISGSVKAICSDLKEKEPVCTQRVCPIRTPPVTPPPTTRVPPKGVSKCVPMQIYNEETHKFEWKQICY
jgi:hypothetical protein